MHRDVIVVGASRGGVEAFTRLVSGLPADLNAALLLVMHLAPQGPSYLADRLRPSSALPIKEAEDGVALIQGCIYVCVPNRHLMIEHDHLRLSRGPKESHARPSVDVLFRSAAYSLGARVIGVVLTGQLDDGTAGLWAIKDRGGIAIAQNPAEAPFPSMPRSALDHVAVDFELLISEMPATLRGLTRESAEFPQESGMADDKFAVETGIALQDDAVNHDVRALGKPSLYTCPECRGSMVVIEDGPLRRYRCHTGHGFTQGALSQNGVTRIEETLWSALAQLEEQKMLRLDLANQAGSAGRRELQAHHRALAARIDVLAKRTRALALDPLLAESQT